MQDPKRPRSHRSRKLRDSSRRRSGSIVVLMALSFVALCGFAALSTDYGQMVWRRNQLQRACDAAALGGASQLPNTIGAQYVAGIVAGQNGVPSPTYDYPNGVREIRVRASQEVSFGFARVIGINSANVTASALAGRLPLRGVPGNVPLAITTDDYNLYKPSELPRIEPAAGTADASTTSSMAGQSFELKLIDNNRQDFTPATAASLDLRPDGSGKSGAVFENDLTYGYPGTIFLNQQISNSLNASIDSQGPKLESAMTQRFLDAAAASYRDTGTNYTYPNYPPNSRRIVTLIVADPNPVDNNNPQVTARAMIPVYIETVTTLTGNYYLRMRILPSKIYTSDGVGVVPGDSSTPDYGLAVIRLLG